jgi:hypothetical protein
MTSAHVAIVDLQLGRLPRRCLVTGESTDNLVKRRLYAAPAWTWWLLPVGLLPAAIVQAAVSDDVRARVPISPQVMAARRRRLGLAGALAGAALPGARSGVRRQTIWLTRVHPDAAAEIDRWMATWAPPPPDDPAQLGWGAPTARG